MTWVFNKQKWPVTPKWQSHISVQFSSVAQSCPTLCDPVNHSTPGLPVHHQLLESTQTHVHCVGDAIQPSHPLSSPSPSLCHLKPQKIFPLTSIWQSLAQEQWTPGSECPLSPGWSGTLTEGFLFSPRNHRLLVVYTLPLCGLENILQGGWTGKRCLSEPKGLSLHFCLSIHSPLNQPPLKVKVAQSCLTLCDPMDNTVHGILQAGILDWLAFPFSRRSSQSRDWTQVSCIAGRFFTSWATREAQTSPIGFSLFIAHSAWPIRNHFIPEGWDSSPLGFHDLLPRLYSILVNQLETSSRMETGSHEFCSASLPERACFKEQHLQLLSLQDPPCPGGTTCLIQGKGYYNSPGVAEPPCLSYVDAVQSVSPVRLLQLHGLQPARLPCPSTSPRVCSNSCPLSQWCHPTISSSVIPFSSWWPYMTLSYVGLLYWAVFSRGLPLSLTKVFFWAALPCQALPLNHPSFLPSGHLQVSDLHHVLKTLPTCPIPSSLHPSKAFPPMKFLDFCFWMTWTDKATLSLYSECQRCWGEGGLFTLEQWICTWTKITAQGLNQQVALGRALKPLWNPVQCPRLLNGTDYSTYVLDCLRLHYSNVLMCLSHVWMCLSHMWMCLRSNDCPIPCN